MFVIVRGCEDFSVVELGWRVAVLSEKFGQCYVPCDIKLHGLAAQCNGLSVSMEHSEQQNMSCALCGQSIANCAMYWPLKGL